MGIVPKMLLDRALQAHPNMSVVLRYQSASSQAEFSSGTPAPGAQSATTVLRNGWTVQTYGGVPQGPFANGQLLALLIGGTLVSLLLGVLVFVLGTSRGRALRLVQERTAELRGAQAQLVDTARQAGMAEMATNVLHNVGNVLNSVNVSANLLSQKVRGSKSAGLSKAVALMDEHARDLGGFLTTDARGRALPGYLDKLATTLTTERESLEEELLRLTNSVAHIKDIVSAQQSLAGVSGVIETVRVSDLLEDALLMAGVRGDAGVAVTLEVPEDDPLLSMDRHRILLVLLNLLGNAMHAMSRNAGRPRQLSLLAKVKAGQLMSITVADNGVGIPPENLTRIFVHGFTTSAQGHGFGLHSSAVAAKEMGGELSVHSDGAGSGAVFTLEVPLTAQAVLV
jgi:signal transduction histidine kinase